MQSIKCFLSAPAFSKINVVKKILMENGVDIIDFSKKPINMSIINHLKKEISEATFAIILLERENYNIYYEIGLCDGLNIPLIIIAENDLEVGSYALSHFFIKTKINDKGNLREILKNYIIDIKNNKLKVDNNDYSINKKNELTKEIKIRKNEKEIENVFLDIIEYNNIKYIKNDKNVGADYVIWDNKIQKYFGSPVIVEIKTDVNNINNTINQLKTYMEKSDAKASILITNNDVDINKYYKKLMEYKIFTISVNQLLNKKYANNFIDSLIFSINNNIETE